MRLLQTLILQKEIISSHWNNQNYAWHFFSLLPNILQHKIIIVLFPNLTQQTNKFILPTNVPKCWKNRPSGENLPNSVALAHPAAAGGPSDDNCSASKSIEKMAFATKRCLAAIKQVSLQDFSPSQLRVHWSWDTMVGWERFELQLRKNKLSEASTSVNLMKQDLTSAV